MLYPWLPYFALGKQATECGNVLTVFNIAENFDRLLELFTLQDRRGLYTKALHKLLARHHVLRMARVSIHGLLEHFPILQLDRYGLHRVRAGAELLEAGQRRIRGRLAAMDALRQSGGPAIAVINKTDLVKEPADLEARKAELKALGVFDAIYTVSVRADDHCEELFDALSQYAVEGPHYFDDDAYTDMPEKELVAEVIREKALLFMRDEIPHGIAVVVERFKERPGTDLVDIDVNIYCERESHKGMVIGKGGAMLKKIASAARADCEEFLGCRVNLQCWVKVKADWRDNEFLLNNFGFKQNPNNR